MKRNFVIASLGALAVGALFSVSASAQTCASPRAWQPDASGNPPISGTTCGGDTTAPGYCGGNFDAPGPAYVIKSTFAAGHTAQTLTLGGGAAGFDPVVYFSAASSPCGTNAACGATSDTATPVNVRDASGDVQNGDWFIVVTAASIDAAGACGPFTLTTNGTFPVSLQSFSVN